MYIIGIVISLIAIGLIFWFRKEYKESIHFLEGEAEATEHGFTALMEDYTNYKVETDRKIEQLEKNLELVEGLDLVKAKPVEEVLKVKNLDLE